MAFLLQRSRHIWQRSGLLSSSVRGATTSLLQQPHAPAFSTDQVKVDILPGKSIMYPANPREFLKKKRTASKAKASKPSGTASEAAPDSTEAVSSKPERKKKKVSGFSFFQKDQYAELKQNSSEKLNMRQASKDVAAKWNSLPDEQKRPYLDKAAAEAPAPASKSKPGKWNSYRVFISENYGGVKARNPAIGAKDVLKAMANEWKSISDKEKEEYTAKAVSRNQDAGQA